MEFEKEAPVEFPGCTFRLLVFFARADVLREMYPQTESDLHLEIETERAKREKMQAMFEEKTNKM